MCADRPLQNDSYVAVVGLGGSTRTFRRECRCCLSLAASRQRSVPAAAPAVLRMTSSTSALRPDASCNNSIVTRARGHRPPAPLHPKSAAAASADSPHSATHAPAGTALSDRYGVSASTAAQTAALRVDLILSSPDTDATSVITRRLARLPGWLVLAVPLLVVFAMLPGTWSGQASLARSWHDVRMSPVTAGDPRPVWARLNRWLLLGAFGCIACGVVLSDTVGDHVGVGWRH